jgi:hypothetical protein
LLVGRQLSDLLGKARRRLGDIQISHYR